METGIRKLNYMALLHWATTDKSQTMKCVKNGVEMCRIHAVQDTLGGISIFFVLVIHMFQAYYDDYWSWSSTACVCVCVCLCVCVCVCMCVPVSVCNDALT